MKQKLSVMSFALVMGGFFAGQKLALRLGGDAGSLSLAGALLVGLMATLTEAAAESGPVGSSRRLWLTGWVLAAGLFGAAFVPDLAVSARTAATLAVIAAGALAGVLDGRRLFREPEVGRMGPKP